WKVNGIDQGTNTPAYTYTPLNNDVVTCILTSSMLSCVSNNPDTSNPIMMIVNPNLAVSITISTPANPFCQGSPVTYIATPVNGAPVSGTPSPAFQWIVNGINVGPNSNVYTYNPANGDSVSCILTSSVPCSSGNPATSNTITMLQNNTLPAGVSITTTNNPFCPGSSVTFTATPINGGIPIYQWKVNGINTGLNANTYTYNPGNGDSVRCIMTSNLPCVTGSPASSAKIIMHGDLAPMVSFSACFDTITTLNAKPIKLKGGIPFGGIYSGPGVNSMTGYFNPALAGVGTKTITYSYTNVALCSATKSISIINYPPTIFNCGNNLTDPRDNRVYPTVQIGGQCWLSANLNFGTILTSFQDQRDNCIAEKYCYNDSPINCTNHGGLYQWDELMLFDQTVASQGFCPPGWHIPSENDWNILFTNYISNAFAGSPLRYSGFSGFNALLSGTRHMNEGWDLLGFATFFWSSTIRSDSKAWAHGMNDVDPSVSHYPASRANAFSVRCLKD
ncbi:MAG TPA: FISUMP domain-containing protein, partial [Leptolinea sp.]